MLLERRTPARVAVMVAAATFDPHSRSLSLAMEPEERDAWITVALVFCSLLLFGVVAS
jgi:hypothetical protein